MTNPMNIAFFTPLNPVQSGISDYSEELLLTLHGARVGGREVDIDLFIDRGYKPSNMQVVSRFDVLPASDFARLAGRYDAVIYQMGNSPAHAYIYNMLMRHAGVVVLHEFVLHHLRAWMTLNNGRRKEYVSIMERQYGAEGREAARRVLLGQYPEALFKYPLSDEVIERATGIIVHSRYMERLVRTVRPDVPAAVVPMGVPLPPLIPKDRARAHLGIDPDVFLVTSVGHLNPYKRIPVTLRAFKALLMEVPRALYLLVGSRSPNYDPTRQIDMLGLGDRVKVTGFVRPQEFLYYLAASDVCINLRWPTAGETSAALLRVMGAGVPVLVSNTGAFEELPDDAVAKVDVGDIEEELLVEYLLLLARRPDVREAMSRAARQYVAGHHTLEGAARGYLRFLLALAHPDPATQPDIALDAASVAAHAFEPAPPDTQAASGSPAPSSTTTPTPARPAPRHTMVPAVGADAEPDPTDPLALVADAAVELGIDQTDEAVLRYVAGALDGLAAPASAGDEEARRLA